MLLREVVLAQLQPLAHEFVRVGGPLDEHVDQEWFKDEVELGFNALAARLFVAVLHGNKWQNCTI